MHPIDPRTSKEIDTAKNVRLFGLFRCVVHFARIDKSFKPFIWIGLLLMPMGMAARADTVYLSNGDEIDGTIQEDNGTTVVIKTASGTVRSFRKADVDSVVYERKSKLTTDLKKQVDMKSGPLKDEAKKDEWNSPPGLTGFPINAKRMDRAKEKIFTYALEKLASTNESVRNEARNDISDLGPDALPYIVAGLQNDSVDARCACMRLLGQFGDKGKAAVKAALESFYSVMPERGAAADYHVPFIRAIKETLPVITGQRLLEADPKSSQVQDGLRLYIEWYNTNYTSLPPQLGEPAINATDIDHDKKIKDARALKLERKKWAPPADPETADKDKTDKTDKADKTADKSEKPKDATSDDKVNIRGYPNATKISGTDPVAPTSPTDPPKTAEDKAYDDIFSRKKK